MHLYRAFKSNSRFPAFKLVLPDDEVDVMFTEACVSDMDLNVLADTNADLADHKRTTFVPDEAVQDTSSSDVQTSACPRPRFIHETSLTEWVNLAANRLDNVGSMIYEVTDATDALPQVEITYVELKEAAKVGIESVDVFLTKVENLASVATVLEHIANFSDSCIATSTWILLDELREVLMNARQLGLKAIEALNKLRTSTKNADHACHECLANMMADTNEKQEFQEFLVEARVQLEQLKLEFSWN